MTTRLRAIFSHTHTLVCGWFCKYPEETYVTKALSKRVTRPRDEYWAKKGWVPLLLYTRLLYYAEHCRHIASSPSFLLQGVEFWNCACLMLAAWCDSFWQAEASLGATCPSLPVPLTPPHPLSTLTQHRRVKLSHLRTNDAGRIP